MSQICQLLKIVQPLILGSGTGDGILRGDAWARISAKVYLSNGS